MDKCAYCEDKSCRGTCFNAYSFVLQEISFKADSEAKAKAEAKAEAEAKAKAEAEAKAKAKADTKAETCPYCGKESCRGTCFNAYSFVLQEISFKADKKKAEEEAKAKAEAEAEDGKEWSCTMCTFLNSHDLDVCEVCRTVKAEAKEDKANSESEAKENADKDEVKAEAKDGLQPTRVKISIPGFQTFYALRWPDESICTVSAVMKKVPTNINEISMQNPFCMLISIFAANISFFVKRGYRSPYHLIESVKLQLNLKEGEMLDQRTIYLIEDIFRVNVDVRFQQNGSNWNEVRNKEWKTLNPIVLCENHYEIKGLDF